MTAITPEMLLGALVLLAFVLLVFAIMATLWARAAFRFGRDFKTFSARREKSNIVVEATFAPVVAASRSSRIKKLGDWLSGRPPTVSQ